MKFRYDAYSLSSNQFSFGALNFEQSFFCLPEFLKLSSCSSHYDLHNLPQILKADEDSEADEDMRSSIEKVSDEGPRKPEHLAIEIPSNAEKIMLFKSSREATPQAENSSERTLSGGLRSPGTPVPRNAILQRINSKISTRSYQLGHQLSRKWSTGAGPRIGCVADYPVQLREKALDFVKLSPVYPSTPNANHSVPTLITMAGPALGIHDGFKQLR